jgi:WD40 repeat protein
MKNPGRRTGGLPGAAIAIAIGAALTGCGGGSDETAPAANATPLAASAVALQAPRRHAMAWNRGGVTAIVASPDGKTVAVAYSDGRIRLLDASNRSEVKLLKGPGGSATAGLIFSSDGRYVVTVGRDSVAQVWSVDSGALRLTLSGHEHPLRSVGASGDGSVVATAGEETRVMLWDGTTGRLKRVLSGPSDFVNSVAVSADGARIASGDASSRVLVWDAATGRLQGSLHGHSGEVDAVAFSPDGRTLASAGEDGKVILWDALGGQSSVVLRDAGTPMRSLAFSRDGALLAVGGADGRVKVWDMSTRTAMLETANSSSAINALAFGVNDRSELLFGDGQSSVVSMSVPHQAAR